ncbi:MAG: hypothetical protein IJ820_07855 [Lachnospiraceae bacterium]|nr:hypothetical protein [Lachnospiraceae bacterium]
MKIRKITGILLACALAFTGSASGEEMTEYADNETGSENSSATTEEEKAYIEETLNLANNEEVTWSYSSDADAWVMSIVSAVAYPELPDQQGVSVCVPGAYVTGIDTDGDGSADVTAQDYTDEVHGALVIDYDAQVTSTNGQVYTAATAPLILNTGAAGYGSSTNTIAGTTYAADGYINIACGNRGKQDTAQDEDGNSYYTGDAPSCLVDQKAAARFVKYNILLGNLPGCVDYLVSTGGSGGGAHAAMFAATSNNSDFYDYQIEAGAVGVYRTEDGYSTTVSVNGEDAELSDGAWGCIAYSAITSLYEGDMTMAFEYYLDEDYDFGTQFQEAMAKYLSEEYMEYINAQELSVEEAAVGFDLNEDGDQDDTIDLTIEYDEEKYPDTNGYGGTYLDLYLAEFTSNLQWYLDNLGYAEGWTWFDEEGNVLSDEEVAAMTTEDFAAAFLEGRYAKGSTGAGGMGGFPGGGQRPDGGMGFPGGGQRPDGEMGFPGGDMTEGGFPGGDMGDMSEGGLPDAGAESAAQQESSANSTVTEASSGDSMTVGTPDAGTTQASGSSTDSKNYSTYEEMLAAYEEDIAQIEAGDEYGNNIVSLYNPLNYIGAEDTETPTWTRILMGASEGDMSMFASLNLQLAWLSSGTDADIAWQWDGGHVPSEILGDSFSLYVDEMYGKYVEGAVEITKEEAEAITSNGTAEEATGTDISSWVDATDLSDVSFTLADAVSYRTKGASKAIPGFDVIDYGQEDYVFGSSEKDARHWDTYVLKVLQEHAEELSGLFNSQDN